MQGKGIAARFGSLWTKARIQIAFMCRDRQAVATVPVGAHAGIVAGIGINAIEEQQAVYDLGVLFMQLQRRRQREMGACRIAGHY